MLDHDSLVAYREVCHGGYSHVPIGHNLSTGPMSFSSGGLARFYFLRSLGVMSPVGELHCHALTLANLALCPFCHSCDH